MNCITLRTNDVHFLVSIALKVTKNSFFEWQRKIEKLSWHENNSKCNRLSWEKKIYLCIRRIICNCQSHRFKRCTLLKIHISNLMRINMMWIHKLKIPFNIRLWTNHIQLKLTSTYYELFILKYVLRYCFSFQLHLLRIHYFLATRRSTIDVNRSQFIIVNNVRVISTWWCIVKK